MTVFVSTLKKVGFLIQQHEIIFTGNPNTLSSFKAVFTSPLWKVWQNIGWHTIIEPDIYEQNVFGNDELIAESL